MKFYRHEKCTTCKKAEAFLKEQGTTYLSINIVETPPTYEELETMLRHVKDIRKLFNTSGQRYRELGLKDRLKTLSVEECLKLLSNDGMLVKRPFLIGDGVARIGFKETEWSS